ncbi:MAG: SOSS complex subunit B family protein [Candidatus Woesearchaeota archaeon]
MGEKYTVEQLEAGQSDITIQGVLKEKAPVRTFRKFGKPGKVASAILKDETGEIMLTLWNEDAEKLEEGEEILIQGADVKEWRGNAQINPGREGSIEVVKK